MSTMRCCASFTVGLGTGMAIASLIAPRRGPDMRNEIREKVRRGAQSLKDAKCAAGKTLEREIDGLGAAIDAGKRAYFQSTGREEKGITVAPTT